LQALGWQKLNLVLLPWIGVAVLALIWLGARQRRYAIAKSPSEPARVGQPTQDGGTLNPNA
jgi:hypothetical protein